jgi:hypothetical protein
VTLCFARILVAKPVPIFAEYAPRARINIS